VLEKLLPIAYEVSVIVARSAAGKVVHLPLQQNLHRGGILAVTQVPSPDVSVAVQRRTIEAAEQIAAALEHVGVLCVEFFVLADGSVIANEMAPRPHNSAHYSVDACDVSQFDLQVRTLTGAPLVTPRLHSAAVMLNLLGDLWFRHGGRETAPPWHEVLKFSGAQLHLYGKASARPRRKMGHLTVTAESLEKAREQALRAASLLGLDAF